MSSDNSTSSLQYYMIQVAFFLITIGSFASISQILLINFQPNHYSSDEQEIMKKIEFAETTLLLIWFISIMLGLIILILSYIPETITEVPFYKNRNFLWLLLIFNPHSLYIEVVILDLLGVF